MNNLYINFSLLIFFLCSLSASLLAQGRGNGNGSTSNQSIWLKADKDFLFNDEWKDQAGDNGVTFSGYSDRRPAVKNLLNFNPSVYFDGNDYMVGLSGGFYTDDYFVVFRANSTITSGSSGMALIDGIGVNGSDPDGNLAGLGLGDMTSAFTNEVITHGVGYGELWRSSQTGSVSYDPLPYIINVKDNRSNSPSNSDLFFNGKNIRNNMNSSFLSESNINYFIGARADASFSVRNYYIGDIAEIMVFSSRQSDSDRLKIQSYLAIKYGITLGITDSPVNYVNANGDIVWTGSSIYQNSVAGIARENSPYELHQKVSSSINTTSAIDSDVTMATSHDFTDSNQNISRPNLADGQYLIWGDNEKETSSWQDKGDYQIVARLWKLENTGSVGLTNFQINLKSYPSAEGDYLLVVDNDEDVSNGISDSYILTKTSGDLFTTSFVPLSGVSNFTIGYLTPKPKPVILDFIPKNACEGGEIVITGSNFYGTTSVDINDIPILLSDFMIDSNTQLTITVPSGATTGLIKVVNSGLFGESSQILTINEAHKLSANITGDDCSSINSGAIDLTVDAGISSSLNFVGTNQSVDLGENFLSNRGEFTLEGWVKFTANMATGQHSFFGQNDAVEFGFEEGKLKIWTQEGGSATYAYSNFPTDGEWHHVAATGDGSSLVLYIDGANVASGGSGTTSYGSSSSTVKFGAGVWDPGTISEPFDGRISVVRFWSVARSAVEISDARFLKMTGSETGLLAAYRLDEAIGNTLNGVGTETTTITFSNDIVWDTYTSPYIYAWTKQGDGAFSADTEDLEDLSVGNYDVIVSVPGCSASDTYTVVGVPDDIAPVIPRLDDVIGECSATAVAPTTTDNCAGTITGTTLDPLIYLTQGTHTITWNFDDSNGNVINVTQDVVIADITDPTIICPADVTAVADAGLCTASSVVLGTPIIADNCMFASGEEASLPAVNLGLAGEFTILSKTGVTSVFKSNIAGDVGSAITGTAITLDCAEVDGTIYSVDAAGPKPCAVTNSSRLGLAVGDMDLAYTDAAGRVNPDFVNLGAGIIGGKTLTPGLYKFTTAVTIPTDVIIAGGPNDIWIFQIAGTLNMSSAVKIILTGGAQAKNIFWQTAGAVTLGTYSHFEGIILGKTNVALQTGASINGRLLAQTAVTLDQNTVNYADGDVTSDAPAVFPIGITIVTWTVTDASGNTGTCKQTVTVSDNEAPTIIAPVDVVVDSDLDSCTASLVELGIPLTDDNCSVATIENNAPITFPLGETIVIWTVTDNVGLKNTAIQKVTVTDNVAPIAICKNITVQLDATCNVTIAATDIDNGSSDNCGITSMSLSQTTFSCFNVGANNVKLSVTDAHGNTDNCIAVITVEDKINPTITCPADVTVVLDAGSCKASSVALGTPIIADNCGEEASLPAVNLGLAGEFTILSQTGVTSVFQSDINGDVGSGPITGAAITLSCLEVTGTIYSVDAAGPSCVVTNASRLGTAVIDMGTAYADAAGRSNPDFLDLGAGNIGGKTLTPGLYKFTTAVTIPTDVTIAGGPNDIWIFQIASTLNMSSAVRITLTGGAQAKNIFWQTAGAVTLGASSHFEGIILGKTSVTLHTGVSVNGILLAQAAVTLQMSTVTNPVALETPTAVDNCTVASLTNNAPEVFQVGTTTVTWMVTDGSGNIGTCEQTITVIDDQNPGIPILSDVTGECSVTVVEPTTEDVCAGTITGTTTNPLIYNTQGTYTITWNFDDGNGNDIDVTQNVIVRGHRLLEMSDDVTICEGETTSLSVKDYSIRFDGENDYVAIPNADAINTQVVPLRTTMLKFKADDITKPQMLYEEGGRSNGFAIFIEGGQIKVYAWNGGVLWGASSSDLLSVGTWHHIAYTWNKVNADGEKFKVYFDGILIGMMGASGVSMPKHSGNIRLGCSGYSKLPNGTNIDADPSYFFKGEIDEFRMWNKELSQDETITEMTSQSPLSEGLIVHYDFDDDTVTGVTDEADDNDGEAEGDVTFVSDNTVLWSPGGEKSFSIDVSPLETTKYEVTVTNENGCENIGNVTVTVNPKPKPIGIFFD